ncbi:hypothetical protein Q1695_008439 [Nippostrongylus brasiliensis]|nr:hypothetical protein Q1695_008439 [Nippostrongylus brasiliensis]
MRVELHPVFNVHIALERLRNVDLPTRGYYQVRLVPKPSNLFCSVDIQYVDVASGSGDSGVLPPSVQNGVGISRSVELTYIDETLTLGDSFSVSLRLDAHADLSATYNFVLDVELWSMDRHRPPNLSLFEMDSRRTVEICICPTTLTAASRELFFDHSAFADLTMTVYASLVSALPRRKRQPPDPEMDAKSRNLHLTSAHTLLQAMSSIEHFVIRHKTKFGSAVHIDPCNVSTELDSVTNQLTSSPCPWTILENTAVNFSARLSVLFSQLVRLCVGSSAISSVLLQEYAKFREKMLSELFFFTEYAPSDLSKCNFLDKVYSVVSKSKYVEKLPRFPIFCSSTDKSKYNWCLVVEERFLKDASPFVLKERCYSDENPKSPLKDAAGDYSQDVRYGSLPNINSRRSWLRRKSGSRSSRSLLSYSHRSTLTNDESCSEPSQILNDNFNTTLEFVMERERLKEALLEQRLFEGFLYSEQAALWKYALPKIRKMQPTHLVVFVHGLEGTCEDLSSYRNSFRVVADRIPGFLYLLSSSNHAKTWCDIEDMADNLLSEIHSYIARYSEPPARISFVAHSLGGVIVRAAVSKEEAAEWLVPRLHCLLTINSPHLGLAYVGKGVNLGIQFMQWWKQSRSMEQLSLKDQVSFCDSFLFRLSRRRTFGHFRNVLLIGTPNDVFVPYHSAVLSPCKSANKDPSALGTTYRDMLLNVHDDIMSSERTTTTIRYSTWHSVSSQKTSRLTGRAAHIAAVEDDIFIEELFAISAMKYFTE